MDFLGTVVERNAHFAATEFVSQLPIMPAARTLIVGCVDPRVDPAYVLGLEQGEAGVIRNVGGRVNDALFETLGLLGAVAKAAGRDDAMRDLVLLQHTDCGIIGCYHQAPGLLAKYLGVDVTELDHYPIKDPYAAIAHDVAVIKSDTRLPHDMTVTGLVYDVATGGIETVVAPAALRPKGDE